MQNFTVKSDVATVILKAYHTPVGIAFDAQDNIAELQFDRSVLVSIKLKEGGHKRIKVFVPDEFTFQVEDEPKVEDEKVKVEKKK